MSEAEPYQNLKPTLSICIVNGLIFPEVIDYHLCFELRKRQHQLLFNDDLQLHMLELPKFKKQPQELNDSLDGWLYFLRFAEGLDPADLPENLKTPEIERAVEVLKMVTQSDLERERYEARVKVQRDELSYRLAATERGLEEGRQRGLVEGQEQGLKQGLQKGLQVGLQKGQLIGRIQVYQKLSGQAETTTEQLKSLSLLELEAVARQLEEAKKADPERGTGLGN